MQAIIFTPSTQPSLHVLHKALGLHTCSFEAQEAGYLALTALLLLTGQKLIDELPDQLLGRSVQHRKNIHNERVHIPGFQTDMGAFK